MDKPTQAEVYEILQFLVYSKATAPAGGKCSHENSLCYACTAITHGLPHHFPNPQTSPAAGL